jgi:hypothetical protein
MLDDLLDDRQSARIELGPVVFERADQGWCSGESPSGERSSDLEFRIRTRLNSPEQLEGCRLAWGPIRMPRILPSSVAPALRVTRSRRRAGVRIFHPVDDSALAAPAILARHFQASPSIPLGVFVGQQRERHDVSLLAAVDVFDRDNRNEGGVCRP